MKTIAFIPVRGGSKSIPLKNIKLFCGKPLVCWNIEALENCSLVDEIVIATDSDEIECAVVAQSYKKTVIYRRLAENASDTATTESVMLEYIKLAKLNELDVFMLVQATSPLTGTLHFTEALSIYKQGKYDSMLTCVRNYRFFWNEDGTPLNYDYHKRPRRQNFSGMLMENGAFCLRRYSMAYEDIYKGLTDEECERMIKADIPKFEVVGETELTDEDSKKYRKDLLRIVEEFKKNKIPQAKSDGI